MKSSLWKILYRRWRGVTEPSQPGYSLLLPVPADLPVFTALGLEVCARQRRRHVAEVLVIPDDPTLSFRRFFDQVALGFPELPTRLVEFRLVDRLLARLQRNGHNNHFLQLMRGVEAARGTHVLLHDSDAFLYDPQFLDRQFEACVEGEYFAYGVQPAWDRWYPEHGYDHVTATWELLMDADWVRSFRPYEHRGHRSAVDGRSHVFDTTLLPQCCTRPERIGRAAEPSGFVHFNYVIVTYRNFLRATGPVEDDRFRLLLVRLLADAFGPDDWPCPIPPLAELELGLVDGGARVTYVQPDTRAGYPEFRARIDELLATDLFAKKRREQIAAALSAFDRAFAWRPAAAAAPAIESVGQPA